MTTTQTTMNQIRFMRYYVTNGAAKCPVDYSFGNSENGGKSVHVYARGYADNLGPIFGAEVINNSDGMIDHFEKDRVEIGESHPLFAAAKAAHDEANEAWQEHLAKAQAKRNARLRLEFRYNRDGSRTLYNKRSGERFAINGVDTFQKIEEMGKALLTIGMRLSHSNWQPVSANKTEIEKLTACYAYDASNAN